jgi:hypothetical protein
MADLEQLSVTLSAKIDDFKKGMAEAVREFDQDANKIEQKNIQLTQSMSRNMQSTAASVRLLTGVLKGLISVYAFQQLIEGAVKANTELSKLATTADRLSISTDKLQSAGYAGKVLGGLSQGDVGQGLEQLRLKASKELRDGEGELTRLFTANNLKLTDRNGKLKDGDALLADAARLISNADSELAKVNIAEKLGLPTDQWIKFLSQGPDAIRKSENAAKTAGAIIDKELIEKAKEFDKAWNQAFDSFAKKAKSTAVEAADAFREGMAILKAVVEQGTDFQAIQNVADRQAKAGNTYLSQLYQRYANEARTRAAAAGLDTGEPGARDLTVGGGKPTVDPPKPKGAGKADELERAEKAIKRQTIALDAEAESLKRTGEEAAFLEAQTKLLETAENAGIKVTAEKRAQIDQLSAAYAKATVHLKAMKLGTDLAFEREQIGRTPDEQAIASRTRGLPTEEAQRLGDQMRTIQNLTEGKEMAGSFVKGLVSDLENGVKAGQALENQLKRILEKLADKALDSLISGLFKGIGELIPAPAQAGGGWAGDGPRSLVPASAFIGARQFALGGGIPAILHAGEIVLNQAQQKNVASAMGPSGPINITHAPVINGTGLSAEQVFAVIQKSNRDFSRQIGPIFADWQRRHARSTA